MSKFYFAFQSLKSYCEKENFAGWDPYDGLTSSVFCSLPFLKKSKFFRLAWIQLFKRLPINLRNILGIKKRHNSKGLALFLSGYCNLYSITGEEKHLKKTQYLGDKLIDQSIQGYSGACWGYYFDWQARAFFQPGDTPTVVATTYAAYALLDLYDITKDQKYLNIARSSCEFVLKDLNRTIDEDQSFAFSYSPLDESVVYNASLLGSRLLARVYSYTKEPHLIEESEKSVRFCCKNQKEDGSWSYGTCDFHQWIDNFHTGFNLECINDYTKYSGDASYEKQLEKGFEYYLNTFFTEEGISKYYNNQTYPVDIHAPAQLVVTLYKMDKFAPNKELVDKVLLWTVKNMQSRKGYFYYQIKKIFSSKIPYMRWAQSWMFYAFTTYFLATKDEKN